MLRLRPAVTAKVTCTCHLRYLCYNLVVWFCLLVPVKWLAGKIVSETTYSVLSGTLNPTLFIYLSRFLGSQLVGELAINLVVGCCYCPPGPQLLSQSEKSPLWTVLNYTAWWQTHTGVQFVQGHYTLVPSQDSNLQPVNRKSIALPVVPPLHPYYLYCSSNKVRSVLQ